MLNVKLLMIATTTRLSSVPTFQGNL